MEGLGFSMSAPGPRPPATASSGPVLGRCVPNPTDAAAVGLSFPPLDGDGDAAASTPTAAGDTGPAPADLDFDSGLPRAGRELATAAASGFRSGGGRFFWAALLALAGLGDGPVLGCFGVGAAFDAFGSDAVVVFGSAPGLLAGCCGCT